MSKIDKNDSQTQKEVMDGKDNAMWKNDKNKNVQNYNKMQEYNKDKNHEFWIYPQTLFL